MAQRVLVFAVASALFAALLEVAAGWVYESYRGRPFSKRAVQARLFGERVDGSAVDAEQSALEADLDRIKDASVPDQTVMIHPYFGFVNNPESPGINDYGFFRNSPLTVARPDTVTVAIFGGSLADQVFYMGGDVLVDQLRRHFPFQRMRVDLVSTALGGYKQPQQLLILSTFFALGAHYDIVINIDGFNEVDLVSENLTAGVNPFYPYRWNVHARQGLDTTAMGHAGRIEIIRERRRGLRRFFSRAPLRNSSFFLTLWDALDRREQAALGRETRRLLERLSNAELTPRIRGPEFNYAEADHLYADAADVWFRASIQMSELCRKRGTEYFHFLQPNQYLPESKPLTEEEREIAYDPEWSGVQRIPQGYSHLVARGPELQVSGVRFVDLTRIFASEDRTVYSDTCCHVNQLGADLLATAIAASIAEQMG